VKASKSFSLEIRKEFWFLDYSINIILNEEDLRGK